MLRIFSTSFLIAGLAFAPIYVSLARPAPARKAAKATRPQTAPAAAARVAEAERPVSFHNEVLPLFRARCFGCHQPAKTMGGYLMTEFDRLLAGGSSRKAAIVPGKPAGSHLVSLITPVKGAARMPMGADPLAPGEIALITRWIAQGARDDSSRFRQQRFSAQNPPVYSRPPVITAIDYSPDGKLLAVAGFYEVLLVNAETGALEGRLVGDSARVESVSFSPDGARLAVTAGQPGVSGEVQIWDVASRKLLRSAPVSTDTVYGARWSPDGRMVSFGSPDNSARAIDAATGEQVLRQASHTDWVLDTVFTADSKHLVSVGRDQSVKLTEVATQRFIDNITSITPGALKGGLSAVERHPQRDEVVIGGSDGTPRVYRVFRQSVRVIGDDANLIRELPALKGRIFSVDVSRDGRRIAAASSLDGAGQIGVYGYEFSTELPEEIKKINLKVVTSRTAEEKAQLEAYHREGVKQIAAVDLPGASVYSVAFSPDGRTLAAAGSDGKIRLYETETGKPLRDFSPAPVRAGAAAAARQPSGPLRRPEESLPQETLAAEARIVSIECQPPAISLSGPFAATQLLVTGRTASGEAVDLTRTVKVTLSKPLAVVSPTGLVQPRADGSGALRLSHAGKSVSAPISVNGMKKPVAVDYIRDVQPLLGRLGCNQGTCHGAKDGKNGFKLSLRGYDPIFDIRALTDDLAARRVNIASPDDSLMLLKSSARVPHAGGQLMKPGDAYYEVIRQWIASGARLNLKSPRVKNIVLLPENPVVQKPGSRQQMRVVATYTDGKTRDVTREAFVESGNGEVLVAGKGSLTRALRRGEAPLLARYEGAYTATTLTVMGDRTGFTWRAPETWGRIDELAAAKWRRMKIEPSPLAGDAEFLRRVHLDLTGLPPSPDQVKKFLGDTRPARLKRESVVDSLIGSPDFVEFWTNKWSDLLQVNRKFLAPEGAAAFRAWIRNHVEKNTPYDEFARQIITATGSNRENPAASYYKILRDPVSTMENTTHLFMAVRFNCNKCHDHPFERWTQDQYYHLAAYFAQVGLKRDPKSGDRNIGGTAVEAATPLYEEVYDRSEGEVRHDRTGEMVQPAFPYAAEYPDGEKQSRRQELAAWLTSPDNQYFARSYVNRIWGYLNGVGLIEPVDDIRAGNPPSNPELLNYLTKEFIAGDFDTRKLMRMIVTSRTYQLSVAVNKWNADDRINYSHAVARRLPAEVLYDSIMAVTGSRSNFPGVPAGTRAAALPDAGVELPSGFLSTFGRPVRESACECERSSDLQLGPIMALLSGPTLADAIQDPGNALTKLAAEIPDDRTLINEIFLRVLNRPATEAEIRRSGEILREIEPQHAKLQAALRQREQQVAAARPAREREREQAIETARKELETYQTEQAPALEKREKERQALIEQRTAALKQFEAETLPVRIREFAASRKSDAEWRPLKADRLAAAPGVKLEQRADLAISATGDSKRAGYVITAPLNLPRVTAIRLEALVDEALPNKGPGRAPDGNFVLTEFEVLAAPASDPKAARPVKLVKPLADFEQENFKIASAVDGDSRSPNTGWAVAPSIGVPHWATFQLAEPLSGEMVLTIKLHHTFMGNLHNLGLFRISFSGAETEVGLSLPEDLSQAVRQSEEMRTPEQQKLLDEYVRKTDADLGRLRKELADAKQPLPKDPKLVELQERLAEASKPLAEDSRLVQLRSDLEQSTKQLQARRLTAVQDIAWALINTPSFLFNH